VAHPGAGAAGVALLSTWLGAALVLPYYGSEHFGLHAIAQAAVPGSAIDLPGLVDAICFNPVPATMFAVGLILLAPAGSLSVSPRYAPEVAIVG
jgi:hypothetical protein